MEGVAVSVSRRGDIFGGVFHGARVLITGHTGFKGAWLCEWLLSLGAAVTGYALEPESDSALFSQLGHARQIRHIVGDVRDGDSVQRVMAVARPDFVFHLAAQSLVRRSYREPNLTWQTNVAGTTNVLEALRHLTDPCSVVIVTSDKCYENLECNAAFRETDPLGGTDTYSSSKAAAELAVASWRRSFFPSGHPVRIATARAGNVIGGGDWAEDRIVPDVIRALVQGEPICVRNPNATRPWQHVLEPSSGYLALATALHTCPGELRLDSAFNIGPNEDANQPVRQLVETALQHWPGSWQREAHPLGPHEAALLQLDASKIGAVVGWRPAWRFPEAVGRTVAWYRDVTGSLVSDVTRRTRADIHDYEAAAAHLAIPWACGVAVRAGSGHDG